MTRHTIGPVGFVLSSLLGWLLVVALQPFSVQVATMSEPDAVVPLAPRSYRGGTCVSNGCDLGGGGQLCEDYACSDGKRLFYVETRFASLSQVRAAYADALRYDDETLLGKSAEMKARMGERTYAVFHRNQVASVSADPENHDESACGVVWMDGLKVKAIYGPSITHVMELEGANPSGRW